MAAPASHHHTQDTMPFDFDKLKGKTLDDAMLSEIKTAFEAESTRAETAEDKARKAAKESISHRTTLKAERDAAFEKLGVSTMEELEALPEAKGQAEAAKQLESKLKKAERERDDAIKARDQAAGTLKGLTREQSIAQALDGLKFKNPADVRVLLQSRVVEEGDELRFKTDDGKLVPLKEGAAWFAKTRPDYVEPSGDGGGGSGFKGSKGAGGGDNRKTMTRAQFDAADHAQRSEFAKAGGQVVEA